MSFFNHKENKEKVKAAHHSVKAAEREERAMNYQKAIDFYRKADAIYLDIGEMDQYNRYLQAADKLARMVE